MSFQKEVTLHSKMRDIKYKIVGILVILPLLGISSFSFSQSDNCNTATSISFTDSTCVSGTSAGATSSNTLYNTCNANPVNEVWYTYTSQGSDNQFDVIPGSLSDAMIVIYTGGCDGSGGTLQNCVTATGNNTLSTSWGIPAGTQVYIGIMSNGGTDGSFDFCVSSTPPSGATGNTCDNAIPYCDGSNTLNINDMSSFSPSGVAPSCFGGAGNQDVFITFTVFQNGTIEWTGSPSSPTEYDWALYETTNTSCPGNEVSCNYNYTGSAGDDFGMGMGQPTNEYNGAINANAGETYVLLIDNYDANGDGFTFNWGGTAVLQPNADFSISPSGATCGSSVTVSINDNSNGVPEWDYGDGSTYTGQNPPDHTYSSPGVYAITAQVGDTSGCFDQHTEFVNLYGPLAATDSVVQETCPGDCDGEIYLYPTGGSGNYNYSWSNGATTPSITGLCAGTYDVTITDDSCSTSLNLSFTISSSEPTGLSFNLVDDTCSKGVGEVNITGVTGGTTPYQYDFNGSGYSTQTSYTGLSSGTYNVTVQDSNGCTYTESVTLNNIPGVQDFDLDTIPETCSNSNGEISVINVTGGNSPYEYELNGGGFQSNNTFTGLTAGSYTITVRDNNGCTYTESIAISNLTGPTDLTFNVTPETCGNSNGEVDITGVTGGNGPYEYDFNGNGFSTNTTYTGLTAGTYSVTVRDTNGCTYTESVTVNNLPGPTDLTFDVTPETCSNSNGAVDITGVTDGNGPYEYDFNGNGFSTNTTYTGLAAGTYSVTVRDTNGCTYTESVSVNNIPGPTDIDFSVVNPTCGGSDGEVNITGVTGGSSPYEYDFNGSGYSTTTTYTGLPAGTYSVTVRDTNGCTYTDDTTLTEAGGPAFDTVTMTMVSCYGACDGSLDIQASGGTTPYEYSVDSGATYQSNSTFTGLCAGTYDLIIRDDNGCQAFNQVIITQPAQLAFDTTITDLTCYQDGSGAIDIHDVTGGTPPYQFSNDGGASFQNDSSFTGLSAGSYDLVLQDANGCQSTMTVTVEEPPELIISNFNVDSVSCNGLCDGAVSAFPAGGTENNQYEFNWSGGIGGQFEAQPDSVCAGSYSVTIMDDNGCTVDTSFSVGEPQPLSITTSSTPANCGQPDGSASVDNVTGGTSPYSYQWNDSNNQTTQTANNLTPGQYIVTVTDDNGCTKEDTVTVGNTSGLSASISSASDATCNGTCDGSATAAASGGTSPYSYQWNDSNNQTTQTASGLCAGTYIVAISDANGCVDTASVTIGEPTKVTVDPSSDTTICVNGTATLSVSASGGTPGYTYHWDQGLGTGQVQNVSPNSQTTYNVYAEDVNGCTSDSATIVVSLMDSLQISVSSDDSICPGASTQLNASGSGGDGSYSYSWSSGDQGSTITVSPTSTTQYVVTLDDGCETPTVQDTVEVFIRPLPDVQISGTNLTGCSPVQATFVNNTPQSMVGGNCVWDFGDNSQSTNCDSATHTFDSPGCYDVSLTVTSPEGCVDSTTEQNMVCVYPYPVADFEFGPQPTTIQDPLIDFTNMSTGATDYQWDFAGLDTSAQENPTYKFPSSGEGVYPVCLKAVSSYGCVDTVCHDVYIGGEFIVYVPNSFTPNGDGVNDKFGPVIQGYDKKEYSFYVFDRWGEIVFESHHPENKWDGRVKGTSTMAKSDVYVWKLITKNKFTGETIERVGHVSIIK